MTMGILEGAPEDALVSRCFIFLLIYSGIGFVVGTVAGEICSRGDQPSAPAARKPSVPK